MLWSKPSLMLVGAILLGLLCIGGLPRLAELVLTRVFPLKQNGPLIDGTFNLVIFVPLLAAGLIGGRLCDTNAAAPGVRPGLSAMLGLVLGVGGLSVAALHGASAGTLVRVDQRGFEFGLFVAGTFLALLQTAAEEVYFRGWLQPALIRSWGVAAGVGSTSLLFAAVHLINGPVSLIGFINICFAGTLFGLLAVRTGGITASLGCHFGWNWAEGSVLGLLPNPGVGSFGTIIDLELVGPFYWGGSQEGLNASLGTSASLAALLLIITLRFSRAPGRPAPAVS